MRKRGIYCVLTPQGEEGRLGTKGHTRYIPDVGEVEEEQGTVLVPKGQDVLHHRVCDVQGVEESIPGLLISLTLPLPMSLTPALREMLAPTRERERRTL